MDNLVKNVKRNIPELSNQVQHFRPILSYWSS